MVPEDRQPSEVPEDAQPAVAPDASQTPATSAELQPDKPNRPSSSDGEEAAQTAKGSEAASDAKGIRSFFSNKRNIGFLVGAVAAVIVLVIVFVSATGALVLGQTPAKFKAAFQSDSIAVDGLAIGYYVNDSPYEVTSFTCTNIRKASAYEVDSDITATIENDNFTTEIVATGIYYDFSNAGPEEQQYIIWLGTKGYLFDVQSSTTTPKKGIDYDTENGLENVDSTLSDDATTCTVTTNDENSFWFADSAIDKTYNYTFDGTSWAFAGMEENDAITYKTDIEGDYAPKDDKDRLPKFTISNLDPEKGTFQIDYEMATTYTNGDVYTASGTINATIEQRDEDAYIIDPNVVQADGKAYYFQGTGSSDSGDGQSEVSGCFIPSDSGEAALEVFLDADYQFEFRSWRESRTMYFRGDTVFKQ